MTEVLRGKNVSDKIKEDIVKDVEALKKEGIEPLLKIVRVGAKPNDISYEKSLIKNSEKLGIIAEVLELPEDITTEGLKLEIESLNRNDKVSGIIIFRPLPSHIDADVISSTISPKKDVDCMNPLNLAKVFDGDFSGFSPGTPEACMEMLDFYGVDLEGKNVVIINRTMVLGKPLAMMMLSKNATVTVCHSRTKDLPSITREADVVVTALGRAKMFTKDYVGEHSICIDVGVSEDSEGKLSGDLDYANLEDYVKMITPVPGGVGAVTTAVLFKNVVKACKL
ncbi:MAG: bifunctional 5,10-methylenetetrahydrofolate dehydrogenase/5,10-methenyltetrahydrofolate cyclohydrolase [Tissierellia bacterium]|nr:bifunctional 5,10-methylenetetrahydrofolate dehydrogenase/5,10-methenyltetrahydrofolate cyclohydrolase [Tissierellia bacterium]